MAVGYPASLDTVLELAATLSGPPQHTTVTTQHKELLTAIMAELGINPSGADATVAALLAALPARYAPLSGPKGLMGAPGSSAAATNLAAAPTQSAIAGLSVTFTAVVGRCYRVTFQGHFASTVVGDTLQFTLFNGAAPLVVAQVAVAKGSTPHAMSITHIITGMAAGALTVSMSGTRQGGTGTCSHYADGSLKAWLIVEDIGAG